VKFILDAQIPVALKEVISTLGDDCIDLSVFPSRDKTPDKIIREFADAEGRVLITKDFDFYHSFMALNSPKKLLLITTGNIKNKELFELFKARYPAIKIAFKGSSLVELSRDEVYGVE
jgi:predicted nuclease of predicted toxin-antitoxin system